MPANSHGFIASDTVLLPYPRSSLTPGTEIRGRIPNSLVLAKQLQTANFINIQPTFQFIGDSILFLATVRACFDYVALKGRSHPNVIVSSRHWPLLRHCDLLAGAESFESGALAAAIGADFYGAGPRNRHPIVTITDDRDLGAIYPGFTYNSEAYVYPKYCEVVPDAGAKEYPSRPARLYLTFEQQTGVVLPADPNDCVPSLVFPDDVTTNQEILNKFGFSPQDSTSHLCALIATTNWPEKKQFGIPNFLAVAEAICSQFRDMNFRFLLVVSPDAAELSGADVESAISHAVGYAQVVSIADQRVELLAYLLSRCDIVIGNDTGVSHLASLCRRHHAAPRTPTVIIYGRGNYTKWTTGGPNVVPVPSGFSEHLTRNNLSPGDIDDGPWGLEAEAAHVSPMRVIRAACAALAAHSH